MTFQQRFKHTIVVIYIYKELFSDKFVNKGMQNELNWVRAIAIFFMVQIHIIECFQNKIPIDSSYGMIANFLGSPPAAPIFIALLGAVIFYSRKNTPKALFNRGWHFLIWGYVFNFVAWTMTTLILYLKTSDVYYLQSSITQLLNIDILQFAGLTFIFFAIVRKMKLDILKVLFIGLCILVINALTYNFHTGNILLDGILGLFIQTDSDICYFPLFSWIIYPIVGYVFGNFLIRCRDKDKLYEILLFFSFVFLIILILTNNQLSLNLFEKFILDTRAYYFQNFLDNIFVISFIFFWISIFYYFQKYIYSKCELLNKTLNRWSKNVTAIYIISYLFITYLGNTEFLIIPADVLHYLLLVIFIFIASDFLAEIYSKYLKPMISKYNPLSHLM
ncbi:MAG: hypothetical protein LBT10_05565 [Methanobrevibacter sp.]|jgi:hypothetical protein|nr:hypothetical protein [Methanobrevibacter sp.]